MTEDVWDELRRQTERLEQLHTKLEAATTAFQIHYSTLHDCAWMDREKMLKALDETAEAVKKILEDET